MPDTIERQNLSAPQRGGGAVVHGNAGMTGPELAKKVADAVLYEGYMLYPYRCSALKNRQRWSFGTLYPPAYEEVLRGTERSTMRSECLLELSKQVSTPRIEIQLRFLQLIAIEPSSLVNAKTNPEADTKEEATERFANFGIELSQPFDCIPFSFHRDGQLHGNIVIMHQQVAERLIKLTVEVRNETSFLGPDPADRHSALRRSMLSAHTILGTQDGNFVSLLDPPQHLRDAVSTCKNIGNFPVLVGSKGERKLMLCSPIVLYDYPEIAPESAGDFYDATEIDEILTLRVMALTEAEKEEMRARDDRIRELLQRTEQTAREQLMRTHGVWRHAGQGGSERK